MPGLVLSRDRSSGCWRQRCHEYLVLVTLGLTPTASVSSKPSSTTLQPGESLRLSLTSTTSHLCRQPYDNQQCGHLLSARPEDTDDTDREEDPEDLFVPELYDDFTPEDTELHLQTDDYDPKYQDEEQEEQEAWLELQTVSRICVLCEGEVWAR